MTFWQTTERRQTETIVIICLIFSLGLTFSQYNISTYVQFTSYFRSDRFLADRTNGRAYAAVSVCLSAGVVYCG